MNKKYEKLFNQLKAQAQVDGYNVDDFVDSVDFVLIRMDRRVHVNREGLGFLAGEITIGDGIHSAYCPRIHKDVYLEQDDFSVISPDENPHKKGPTWEDCVRNAFAIYYKTHVSDDLLDSLLKEGKGEVLVVEMDHLLGRGDYRVFNAWITQKADINLELENYEPVFDYSIIRFFDLNNFGKEFGKVRCHRRFELEE